HILRVFPLFQHEGVEFIALQDRRRERIVGGFFSPRDPRTRAVEADLSENYERTSGTRSNGAKRRIRTVEKLRHPDALEHVWLVGGQPVVVNTGVHPVRRDGSHPGYRLAQVGHHIRDVVTHEELAAEASQLVPTLHLRGLGRVNEPAAVKEGEILARRRIRASASAAGFRSKISMAAVKTSTSSMSSRDKSRTGGLGGFPGTNWRKT
ncbi:hypothetical protein C8R47DRAFT_1148466, partial [Mycena vitilis]